MALGNQNVSLPRLNRGTTSPSYGALIPVNGNGNPITFTLNPQRITATINASYSEVTLFRSKVSPSRWMGNKADRIRLEDVYLTQGRHRDVRPLMAALAGACGGDQQWSYVHGKRIIAPVSIVSVSFVETDWLAGIPVMVVAQIEMVRQYNIPSVITKVSNALTKAEIATAKKLAEKAGFKSVTVSDNGAVFSNGKQIGTFKAGKFQRINSTGSAINSQVWRPPTANWKPGQPLPKGYPPPPSNYGVTVVKPKPVTKPLPSATVAKINQQNSWSVPNG